jgi:hypothetical protein
VLEIEIDTKSLVKFRNKLKTFRWLAEHRAKRANKRKAEIVQKRVRQNASGRPGPNVVTGEYRDSIRLQRSFFGDAWTVTTKHPAAERLEFGFVGVDSLGRVYNQPPFAHWRPALEQTKAEQRALDKQAITESWEESS